MVLALASTSALRLRMRIGVSLLLTVALCAAPAAVNAGAAGAHRLTRRLHRQDSALQPSAESVHAHAHGTGTGTGKNLPNDYYYPLFAGEDASGKTGVAHSKVECRRLAGELLTTYGLQKQGDKPHMLGVMVTEKSDNTWHLWVAMSADGSTKGVDDLNGQSDAYVTKAEGIANKKYTVHVYDGRRPKIPDALDGKIPYPLPYPATSDQSVCAAKYVWSGDVVNFTPSKCTADELDYSQYRNTLLGKVDQWKIDLANHNSALYIAWKTPYDTYYNTRTTREKVTGDNKLKRQQNFDQIEKDAKEQIRKNNANWKQVTDPIDAAELKYKQKDTFGGFLELVNAKTPNQYIKAYIEDAAKRFVTIKVPDTQPKDVYGKAKNKSDLLANDQKKLNAALRDWFLTTFRGGVDKYYGGLNAVEQKKIDDEQQQMDTDNRREKQADDTAIKHDRDLMTLAVVNALKNANQLNGLPTMALERLHGALDSSPSAPFDRSLYAEVVPSAAVDVDTGYPYGVCAGSRLAFMIAKEKLATHRVECVAEAWSNIGGTVSVSGGYGKTKNADWKPLVPSCPTCRQVMRHFLDART